MRSSQKRYLDFMSTMAHDRRTLAYQLEEIYLEISEAIIARGGQQPTAEVFRSLTVPDLLRLASDYNLKLSLRLLQKS